MPKQRWIVAALVLMSGLLTAAQQQAALTEASFEAATIKRNLSGADGWALNPRPTGQFRAINARVVDLLQGGFLLQPDQLGGLPSWVMNERYDIVAKLDPAIASHDQPPGVPPTWSLALRAFLVDELKLKFHRQVEQRRVFALVVAREGQLGPRLKRAAVDCDALRDQTLAAGRAGRPSPVPPPTPDWIACGQRIAPGRILYGGVGFKEFGAFLSRLTGRAVLDRTGLAGNWDVLVTYATEAQLRSGEPTDSPDLFTALTEQLGLKLEPTTGPVEMFVVDQIERPQVN